MEINKAERLTRKLMNKHGLVKWDIKVEDTTDFAAACLTKNFAYDTKKSTGTIYLSRPYMIPMTDFQVRQVVIHEIAHALVDPRLAGEKGGHGLAWEAKARELGYVFDDTMNSSFPSPVHVDFKCKSQN